MNRDILLFLLSLLGLLAQSSRAETEPEGKSGEIFPSLGSVFSNIAVDNQDNVFLAANYYDGRFGIRNAVFTNASSFGAGSVLTKFDTNQDVKWSRQLKAGRNMTGHITSVVPDSAGNSFVFVSGSRVSTKAPMGSISFAGIPITSSSSHFAALFKINPKGTVVWHKKYPGFHNPGWAQPLAIDSKRNVYVAGRYANDVLLVEKIIAGTAKTAWQRRVGRCDGGWGPDLAVLPDGNLYLAGNYTNTTARFGSILVTNQSGSDSYLLKLAPNGFPTGITTINTGGGQGVQDLGVDNDGNSYLSFGAGGSDLVIGTNVFAVTNGNHGVIKINPAGNPEWVTIIENATSPALVSIAPDKTILFSGHRRQEIGSNDEALLLNLDTDGETLWTKLPNQDVTTNYSTAFYSRALYDSKGQLHVSGRFSGPVFEPELSFIEIFPGVQILKRSGLLFVSLKTQPETSPTE